LSFHAGGAIAALLLLALWYCAALIGGDRDTVTDRLRNAAIAGIALGFVLGLTGLLTPAAYAIALAALCAARFVFRRHAPLSDRVPMQTYFLPALAVVAIGWPQLVRPLMDGDSLAYHLPNAAAWVHGASLWTTTTRYWWFPPASELFAAGLYLLSGAFSVGLAGSVALLLLGFRLAEWCGKRCGPWAAGAISAATISLPALALQGGNLLNDVWLAAFFVESLFANRFAPENSWRSLATTALIKPIGIAYALIAHVDSPRRFTPALLLCYLPLGVWIVHDIVLWPHAAAANTVTSLTTSQFGHVSTWQTTVLAHGLDGVKTLAAALWHEGFWAIIVTLAALIAPLLIKDRVPAFAAYASFALFFVLPFAYENDSPQLATGHALRLFVPLLVLGAIAASEMLGRYAPVLAAAAIAASAYNIYRVDAIFWNDATTHRVLFVCAITALVLAIFRGRYATPAFAALACALIVISNGLAQSHPLSYYDDWISTPAIKSHFFDWLAAARPPRIVVQNLRAGAINVVAPSSVTFDQNPDVCMQARALDAFVVSMADSGGVVRCGRLIRDDGLVAVSRP
jgi:hypothetical protein